MSILASYSPEDIIILAAGVITISGFVDGTFITISRDVPSFSAKETSDGVVSRSHSSSMTYTVKLTLASTSDSNQHLTYLSDFDRTTTLGVVPFLVKDSLGSTLLFSTESWIERDADTVFSDNISDREWTIKCANAVLNIGGNKSPSSTGQDVFNVATGFIGGML